ncbi:MAG: hypothetical protein LT102_04485 [Burkholderiaceae bacterium]|nr:hypothetical protein [Burkholderiaceae bacterium]
MDRHHLGAWSLGVEDERFVAALAALGVLTAFDRTVAGQPVDPQWARRIAAVDAAEAGESSSALFELLRTIAADSWTTHGILGWRVPTAPAGARAAPAGLRQWPSAASLADAWERFTASESFVRLAALEEIEHEGRVLDFVEALSHPAAKLAGVHVQSGWKPEHPTQWRWPFTVSALPGDPLGKYRLAIAEKYAWPAQGARFVIASRRTPRVELLALAQPLPFALARVLEAAALPRCALAVVAGFGSEWPTRSAPLVRALAARVQADGVVVAPAMPAERLSSALAKLSDEMARGCPLDVALMRSIGPGHVAWLGAKLIEISERAPARQASSAAAPAAPRSESAPMRPTAPSAPMPGAPPRATSPGKSGARWGWPFERRREVERMKGPRAAPSPVEEAPAGEPPPPPPVTPPPHTARSRPLDDEHRPARHLQQRSLRKTVDDALEAIHDGYVQGEPVMLLVRIGTPDDASWDSVATPFPEHELPKDRDTHTLQIVVHEARQFDEPMLREITLPRAGPSTEAEFVFTPRSSGAFDARIGVLHRGRVLQTARLRTQVRERRDERGEGIALLDETQVRFDWSDLGARRPFDLALVLNHGETDGVPRLTAVAERRAWATSLEGLSEPLLQLNEALSDAAHSIADHADGLDQGENPQLLVRLARVGADLYSALCLDQFVELAHGGFDPRDDALTHIQVVSARADAVVPIEFFYDYPPPAPDADQLCPGFRQALKTGSCPSDCAGRADPAAYVCPMGFWGLRKVVERHVYSPALGRPDGAEVVIQSEPAEGRDRLDLGRCAVLGFSAQVPKDARTPLLAMLSPRFGDATLEARTWQAWKETVGQRKPALLVAFPHNEGRRQDLKLEIGGDFLATLRLPRDYVRPEGAPPPLVFLLGCDVAGTAEPFSNHIRYFRQAGAAVVISTTATVFGEHAVTVGSKILARLLRAGGAEADQLGELILDARREAMLESLPMALCIVAFGDADWRL